MLSVCALALVIPGRRVREQQARFCLDFTTCLKTHSPSSGASLSTDAPCSAVSTTVTHSAKAPGDHLSSSDTSVVVADWQLGTMATGRPGKEGDPASLSVCQ